MNTERPLTITITLTAKRPGQRLSTKYADKLERDLRALASTLHGRGFKITATRSGPEWEHIR